MAARDSVRLNLRSVIDERKRRWFIESGLRLTPRGHLFVGRPTVPLVNGDSVAAQRL